METESEKVGETGQHQVMQNLIGHFLSFGFYPKTNGKPMKSFMQKVNVIRSALQKQFTGERWFSFLCSELQIQVWWFKGARESGMHEQICYKYLKTRRMNI